MSRSEEHVTAFIFTELGTSGSVDGSRRLGKSVRSRLFVDKHSLTGTSQSSRVASSQSSWRMFCESTFWTT